MLKTFEQCPYKYYLKYILNVSAPQKSTPFEKGKRIHALANYLLRGEDVSKLESTLTSEEASVWQKLKTNEYFQKKYVNSEYNLSCKIGKYWIGGRLDALVKEDGHYFILDYKTGSIPKNPESDYQTMVYLIAAVKFLKDAQRLTFVYIDLKNNKNYCIELTKELKAKYIEELQKTCEQITFTKDFPKKCFKYCEYKNFC